MKLPSHIPLMLHTAEVLVAMVISSPNSIQLYSTPFDEILPILAACVQMYRSFYC